MFGEIRKKKLLCGYPLLAGDNEYPQHVFIQKKEEDSAEGIVTHYGVCQYKNRPKHSDSYKVIGLGNISNGHSKIVPFRKNVYSRSEDNNSYSLEMDTRED